MLIRHAEKPSASRSRGVTVESRNEKESLSVRGWQRAGALTSFFAPFNGYFEEPLIDTPRYLYASKPKRHNGSRRPVETITPLAEKLMLKINSEFAKYDYDQMLEDALNRQGVVLICWQREYLPQIANLLLGDEVTAPQNWLENRYDMIWVCDLRSGGGKAVFKQVPQNLLADDLESPIK